MVFAYLGGDHVLRFAITGIVIIVLSLWAALAKHA